jgi:hypothetical protein
VRDEMTAPAPVHVDPSAAVLETLLKPQHLSSLLAVLVAAALIAFKHRASLRVAVVVAWIEIAAFTFFHVITVRRRPLEAVLGVTGWETRCGRASPSARPSSASRAALDQGGRHPRCLRG